MQQPQAYAAAPQSSLTRQEKLLPDCEIFNSADTTTGASDSNCTGAEPIMPDVCLTDMEHHVETRKWYKWLVFLAETSLEATGRTLLQR